MKYGRLVALTLLLLGWTGVARATCGARPADAGALATVQAAIATQCECCGPRLAYARCVQSVVRRAVGNRSLRAACVPTVKRAAIAVCPLAGTTIPCRVCNADADCGSNQLCECRPGTCSKTGGTCVTKPPACPDYFLPVCGCDGTTFSNDCFRRAAGACKAHDGACGPGCQSDADCDDHNGCTVDRCVDGTCEHLCVCVAPASGATCCGPGPLCVTTTTSTTLPSLCGGPEDATCGGSCPFRSTCEPTPTPTTVGGCRCVSSEGGPCGGNIDMPPAVCGPGLVCQQSNPDATGVCVVPGCIPLFTSGCTQTPDCCEPCSRLGRAPCGVCINGFCSGAP
jgi:hypothetical protein